MRISTHNHQILKFSNLQILKFPMKQFELNKHFTLQLPEDWTEVEPGKREKGFALLLAFIEGQISYFEFQLQMLILVTGYRPSRKTRRAIRQGKPIAEIEFNLIRLAEEITFAFNDGKIRYAMMDAPFPCTTRFDRRGEFIDTNMTAGQYVDAIEILGALNDTINKGDDIALMQRLALLLGLQPGEIQSQESSNRLVYQIFKSSNHQIGLPLKSSNHQILKSSNNIEDVSFEVLFALTMWMTGIAEFFQTHPIYGVLFTGSTWDADGSSAVLSEAGESTANPYNLGLREVMLELQQRGYNDVEQMPVEKFMAAQLKMLKDNLQRAVHEGVKIEELSRRTGIPLQTIKYLI